MALNFPGSPTNGQQYQGFVYNSTVGAWQANPASVAPFYTADLPPTNPTKGDSWFNTNDGTMYVYTYDGNTYQWVEHRSEIARSQVGLVPIVPTSVNVGSGTASVAANGLITFTGANSLRANGVFTSAYNYHRVIIRIRNVGSTGNYSVQGKFSVGGVNSDVNYDGASVAFLASTGGAQNLGGLNSATFYAGRTYDSGVETMSGIDIASAAFAEFTNWNGSFIGSYPSDLQQTITGGRHRVATAYDGFYWGAGAAMTGTMKVYGYN